MSETTTKKEYESFAEKVWDILSNIDVSTHTEVIEKTTKRPEITYLPWHKAWMFLKREFPGSTYEHLEDLIHHGNSMEVEVHIQICGDNTNADIVYASARLPVMDNWFNPIHDPESTDLNKSRQRCLVKALAFAGLGLNLWSESALPVGKLSDPINTKQVAILEGLLDKTGVTLDPYLEWLGVETLGDIPKEMYPKAKLQLEAKILVESS